MSELHISRRDFTKAALAFLAGAALPDVPRRAAAVVEEAQAESLPFCWSAIAGGVIVGVKSADAAKEAFNTIVGNAKKYDAKAEILGVQIQQMQRKNLNIAVGPCTFSLANCYYASIVAV